MTDATKIVYTASLTVLGSVILFVLSKWLDGFVFGPMTEEGKARAAVAGSLYYYENVFASPHRADFGTGAERHFEAKAVFRKLAEDLIRANGSVGCYWILSRFGWILSRHEVKLVVSLLTGLSNGMFDHGDGYLLSKSNVDSASQIKTILKWPV